MQDIVAVGQSQWHVTMAVGHDVHVAFCSHWICVWLSMFLKLLLSVFWSKYIGSSLSFFSLVTDMLLDLKSISLCCWISSQFCWDWPQKFMAENNAVEHTMQPAWEQDEPEMITSSTSDRSLLLSQKAVRVCDASFDLNCQAQSFLYLHAR